MDLTDLRKKEVRRVAVCLQGTFLIAFSEEGEACFKRDGKNVEGATVCHYDMFPVISSLRFI